MCKFHGNKGKEWEREVWTISSFAWYNKFAKCQRNSSNDTNYVYLAYFVSFPCGHTQSEGRFMRSHQNLVCDVIRVSKDNEIIFAVKRA